MNDNYETLYHLPEGTPQTEPPAREPVTYTKAERLLAVGAFAAGIGVVRLAMYHASGVLTTLLFWAIFAGQLVFLKKNGQTLDRTAKLWAGVLFLFSCVFTVTASGLLKALTVIFLLMAGTLFLLRQTSPEGVLRFLPVSLALSVCAMPFANYATPFVAVTSGARSSGVWKKVGYVALGLLFAVPLTAIVGALLCSADDGLSDMIDRLLQTPPEAVMTFIPHAIGGVLIGAGICSAVFASVRRTIVLDAASTDKTLVSLRFVPPLFLYSAVTPLCVLFVLYIISQASYFLGGFTGQTGSLTYAEYARKGFFELCAVCCISLAVIAAMGFFAKRGEDGRRPVVLRIYAAFLSLASLFIAGTALAKMFLYIRIFGMTQMRVYTSWFILLLVIGFISLLLRQIWERLPLGRIAAAAFTIMFGLLCFSRPDAWITRYNAEQYLAGHLEEFDTDVLIGSELSDDAWAALTAYDSATLARLSEKIYQKNVKNGRLAKDLRTVLKDYPDHLDMWERMNVSAWQILLYR